MLSEAYGTPIEVEIGGEKYKMTRLLNKDFGELEDYVRGQRLRLLNEWLAKKLIEPLEYRWQLAHLLDARENFTLIDLMNLGLSRGGMNFTLWMMLRKNHPELKLTDIETKVPVDELMVIANALNQFTTTEDIEQSESDSREGSESETDGTNQRGGASSSSSDKSTG